MACTLGGAVILFLMIGIKPFPAQPTKALSFGIASPSGFACWWSDFTFLRQGNVWHMFSDYDCLADGATSFTHMDFMHTTSLDLYSWTKVGPVVLRGAEGSWDATDISAPSIITSGDTYNMFYTGMDLVNGNNRQRIGLATSTDLTTWTKSASNPIFDCSTLTWNYWDTSVAEGMDCRDPFVIRDQTNNRWVMFYTARSKFIDQDPLRDIPYPAIVGTATSTDLIAWTDAGSILATAGIKADSPHVISRNGTWYLIWTSADCELIAGAKCLKYATSSELLTGYAGYNDLPDTDFNKKYNVAGFASEYYNDAGQEYLAYSPTPSTRTISAITWPDNVFTVVNIPYATISGLTWYDINQDGQPDDAEARIDGAAIVLYRDNGDGIFDPASDLNYGSKSSARGSHDGVTQHGTYSFTTVLPGSYWVTTSPTSYLNSDTLAGYQPTNNATSPLITVDYGEKNTDNHRGYISTLEYRP